MSSYLPPYSRHTRATECARLMAVPIRRGSWRSHVRRTFTPQAEQFFKPETGNVSLSLGVIKGVFSFGKENTPFDWHGTSAARLRLWYAKFKKKNDKNTCTIFESVIK